MNLLDMFKRKRFYVTLDNATCKLFSVENEEIIDVTPQVKCLLYYGRVFR